jgi:membrane peptidoglycan carboxypeptidase
VVQVSINTKWNQLRDSIEKLELELAYTEFPKPTRQMCEFLVAGEDRRFYLHPGVDPIALCRALWKTCFCGSRQGASTIAMQLVRTTIGCYEQTLRRKLIEIYLAVRLSEHVSRDNLPILYLWVAYYGWRMNDYQQACIRLEIDPRTVNALEAAKLVARLKYPEPKRYNAERTRAIHRRAHHLITMANRKNFTPNTLSGDLKWNHSSIGRLSKG